MALAETAELIAKLRLQDELSGPMKGATGSVTQAEQAIAKAGTQTSRFSTFGKNASDAVHTFTGRVSGLAKVLGAVGLLGGVIGVVGAFKSGIEEARSFGNAAEDMSTTLNITRGNAQLLLFTFKQFGVEAGDAQKIVGMLEKNVGNLSLTAKGASDFYAKFGFNIQDSTGKIKDANTLISDFTDFWNNKTIPAEQKVAAGAALFGRSWQGMLEVLQSGSGAWRDANQRAKDLGLAQEDITANAEANEAAMFRWNSTLDALKITIGSQVLPVLTDLADQATRFATEHRQDITAFFLRLRDVAKNAISFITGTVLPTIGSLADAAGKFWNSIPDPLRDLLVKGFVADRTIKFLFGFSLMDVGKAALGPLVDIIGKQFLGRGSNPANPLYVLDVTGGGKGGVPGAGGGIGGLVTGIAGAATLAGAFGLAADQLGRLPDYWKGLQELQTAKSIADFKTAWHDTVNGSTLLTAFKPLTDKLYSLFPGGAAAALGLTSGRFNDQQGLIGSDGMKPLVLPTTKTAEGVDELKRIGQIQTNQLGAMVKGVQELHGSLSALQSAFLDKWDGIRESLGLVGKRGEEVRREIAKGLGITVDQLITLRHAALREMAHDLGISVGELKAIRRSADGNDQILADKLGISIDQLREIRDKARTTAIQTTKIAGKDFSPTVNVQVRTMITTRDVVRSVSMNTRYGKFAT